MKKKIGFIASSGGHWEELLCLREIAEDCSAFFVTEKGGQSDDCQLEHLYALPQINRKEKHFVWHFFRLMKDAYHFLRNEEPDVIITTGALLAFPFCLFAKCMHKKVIYIESFARVHEKSLTGKLVYPFADLFIVQWESMLETYPKAIYGGSVF